MLGLATVVALQGTSLVASSTSALASDTESAYVQSTTTGTVSSSAGAPEGYSGQIAMIESGESEQDQANVNRTSIETYLVQEGDTIRSIAARYGLQTSSIFWANSIENPDIIVPGQELTILPTDGVLVEVAEGDTLWSIALEWGSDPNAIFNHPANGLTSGDLIVIGQHLVVPGGRPFEQPAPAEVDIPAGGASTTTSTETAPVTSAPEVSEPVASETVEEPVTSEPEGEPAPAIATVEEETAEFAEVEQVSEEVEAEPEPVVEIETEPTPVPPAPTPIPAPEPPAPQVQSSGFIKPTQGALTQHFGWTSFARANPSWYGPVGHPGIDFAAPAYTPIVASAGGTVIHSGWSGGYGHAVGIDHGNGYATWYAHLAEQPPVRAGQWVDQGQYIGPMGTTGASTGNHLHFELRKNGQFVDPLSYIR